MRHPESIQPHPGSPSLSPSPSPGVPQSSIVSDAILNVGHTNGNGVLINGSGPVAGNGVLKKASSIAQVNLPGTTLYDDSSIDREEFVRLVIQTLRDVGYIESAAALEAESGYRLETFDASLFRQHVLDGMWNTAESALMRLDIEDEERLWEATFLLRQQKYLELLEAKKTTAALHVLRYELAKLHVDPDQLHTLSSLIMCTDPEDLRKRAGWDGALGHSRSRLLNDLHHYIPPSVMIPQRRLPALLQQAKTFQRERCQYHNSPAAISAFSLYADHQCSLTTFPRATTFILEGHKDEVWNMEWSHDGAYLASASKDKTAIIWHSGASGQSGSPPIDWSSQFILKDHRFPVGCLAWSLDDSILITSAEHFIKLWNAKTGICIRTLEEHKDIVTALSWLPDGSGFVSGSLDRKIMHWDAEGNLKESWGATPIRVTDLAVSPDFKRLVTIGMEYTQSSLLADVSRSGQSGETVATTADGSGSSPSLGNEISRLIIYNWATKEPEASILLEGELTSVKVSSNSQYALINNTPDAIQLWDLETKEITRTFTGQKQGHHVIRSCFGGCDGNFVVSGSEDGKVYVWNRETGTLIECLGEHGNGSVNSVAWNPRNSLMFASCSDDCTIRIWEAPQSVRIMPSSSSTAPLEHSPARNGKGKGKTRQHLEGETNVASVSEYTRA